MRPERTEALLEALADADRPWHTASVDEVARRLGVDPGVGLAAEEALRRARRFGPNALPEARRRGPWRLLARQFRDFMILLLFAAALVAGLIGEPVEALAIVAIVLVNGAIGFVQELRAERAAEALRALAAPGAMVRRDGRVLRVPAAALVPGDVVLLEAGDIVPADLRLSEAARLQIDESALSGESVPVEKHTEPSGDPALALADRANQAWKGTVVTVGRGRGLAVATGARTELGRIAALLEQAEAPATPLQRRLAVVGRRLALAALAICACVFALGWLRGEPPLLMLLTAVSLAVAAIPEALPAVVTVSLALGARALARRNALVRRLPAVETLGSVTFICADKTGTLTQNRMQLESLLADGAEHAPAEAPREGVPWERLYQALALDNDAAVGTAAAGGDPTERALAEAAERAGYPARELNERFPRLAELPFDSERRCMTTFHRLPEGFVSFTKGAPEAVIARCESELRGDGLRPADRAELERQAERLAAGGLRVLAVAFRAWPALPATLAPAAIERGLVFLGLAGLLDPPRPAAGPAVELCRTAGITPRDDHRRSSGHRPGDRRAPRHREQRRRGADGPGARGALAGGAGGARGAGPRLRAGGAGAEARDRARAPGSRRDRRDDRRRRERRAGPPARRHRRRHGPPRHRRRAGGRADDPPRRRLRDDRGGGRARGGGSTTTSASSCATSSRRNSAEIWDAAARAAARASGCPCCRSRSSGSTS